MINKRKQNQYVTLIVIVLFAAGCSYSGIPEPTDSGYENEVKEFRQKKDQQFKDTARTPFPAEVAENFDQLNYYDIEKDYVVWAQFERTESGDPFVMPTTGSKEPYYVKYGKLKFTLNGKKEDLTIYRNLGGSEAEQTRNYLFVPFKDLTNGETTYAGGRYLDMDLPLYNGQLVKLDFNRAYNPFCVYNYSEYDCPIPPEANHLDIGIEAGEKMYNSPAGAEDKTMQ